ncbi:ABC transporter ATP-binding protein [Pseudobutyrivibrio xylanivorans]|uniref:ABC-2 type transport system ATP-binding protein n=1 Tax=Pseudobutyrivibrio xylanivorans TaxID=185007 RepID=A0A1G5RXR5_PSEXY|nr:ABC transporter ATP-binding protein [Pseudobutyrivibrio xylanivorans]SCZ78904.1 ABC-2 type transport system ATP-binding protein [Pseudobutyrivibrio xylanivorans]
MTNANYVLEVKNLSKNFKEKKVIDNASFAINRNSIVGIIGKNGAGKTTLMRMIMGFLKADKGEITVDGEKVSFGETSGKIAFMSDVPVFYDYMTACEYMKFVAELKGIEKTKISDVISKYLDAVGLVESKDKKIGGFSRGMRQRLGIAQCLIGNPSIIIFDEPMSALDPGGRAEVIEIMKRIKERTSILLSTHLVSDIEKLCDDVIILENGETKKMEKDRRENLFGKSKMIEISFDFQQEDEMNLLEEKLKNMGAECKKNGNELYVIDSNNIFLKEIYTYFSKESSLHYPVSIRSLSTNVEDLI